MEARSCASINQNSTNLPLTVHLESVFFCGMAVAWECQSRVTGVWSRLAFPVRTSRRVLLPQPDGPKHAANIALGKAHDFNIRPSGP